jgi:regulator of nucleoside diphosphate kinase
MSRESFCQLTAGDVNVLMSMLDYYSEMPNAFTVLLREKLSHAEIFFKDDISPGIVTLDSRILYSVNGRTMGPQVLVRSSPELLPDYALSVHTMRGLALLGIARGETVDCRLEDGTLEVLRVESVFYQPEADEKAQGRITLPTAIVDPAPQVVQFRSRKKMQAWTYDDDPGPSAA